LDVEGCMDAEATLAPLVLNLHVARLDLSYGIHNGEGIGPDTPKWGDAKGELLPSKCWDRARLIGGMWTGQKEGKA
jgi:hypothetical protein